MIRPEDIWLAYLVAGILVAAGLFFVSFLTYIFICEMSDALDERRRIKELNQERPRERRKKRRRKA